MADQQQKPNQGASAADPRKFDHDDNPGHAPESGEPTETGKESMRGAKDADSGKRDESARQSK
jgi:hypothetical protein